MGAVAENGSHIGGVTEGNSFPKEVYRELSFKEVLTEVFPQTKGTEVPKILAGFLVSIGGFLGSKIEGEKALITESAALILNHPSEKGRQASGKAIKTKSKITDQGKIDSLINSLIRRSLETLSEGPDLDIKLFFAKGYDFNSLEKGIKKFLGEAAVKINEAGDVANFDFSEADLILEVTKARIPVYDENNPQVREKLSRPLLELKFRKRDGGLILKVHLTSIPEPWERFEADCRLGVLSSYKQCYSEALIVFPEGEFFDPQKDYSELLKVRLFIGQEKMLLAPDWYPTYGRGLDFKEEKPIRLLIGVLRMMVITLLTQTEEQIRNRDYLRQENREEIKEAFSRIKKERIPDFPEEAKFEIITQFLLGCLIDRELFLEMAEDLGILELIPQREEILRITEGN